MLRILVFCIALFSICFGAYENELANFDKNFIMSKNDAQVKFHHQLKSLYIQSVINEDEKTKIEILKRLIISSNALNLDDKSYANELEESGVSKASINALRKAVVQDKQKLQSSSKNVELSSFDPPKSTPKPQQAKQEIVKTQNNKSQQTKKVDKVYVLKSSKTSQGVVLDLNTNLEQEDIKSFALDEKGNYRYISDFEGVLEGGRKEYKFDDYRIVISQYNPKTIRIVAYAKEKIPIEFDFEDEKINISKKSQPVQKNISAKQETKTAVKKESDKVVAKQEPKQVKTQEAKTNTKKEQADDEPLYVLDVDKSSNSVVLNLSDELDEKDITSFSTKDQKFFRQVVSFQGILEGSRKNFTFGQNAVTVTQYNPKTVRIVLSSPKEFKLFKELDGKNLTLGFGGSVSKNTSVSSKSTSKTSNKNVLNSNFKSDKLIVLDAGHGGKDSGALSDKKGT